MTDTLLEQLRRVRPDHATEAAAHRFLLEAYSGSGGFSPSVTPPPASWWGAAAVDYARGLSGSWNTSDGGATPSSWLDRYPREDSEKFRARIAVAHYPNYVEQLTELKCSYVLREPFAAHGEPDEIGEWKASVDGDETTWADWLPDIVTQAAVLGWAPVLLDAPPMAEGLSRAQAEEMGAGPTLTALFPSQLLEWSAKGKRFEWVKIRTDHIELESWTSEPVEVERYAIWTPADVTVIEVRKAKGRDPTVGTAVTYKHGFGRVPLAVLRHSAGGDAFRGRPMHWAVSQENKRLFNLLSELDEHTRSNVFALLVYPGAKLAPNGEVDLGAQNGLIIDPDQKNVPQYIAPPASVADTLEKRAEATVREIYRLARVEFTRPSGAAVSGVSREYEFEQTNRALGDFARQIAAFELNVADLVGTAVNVPIERRRKHTISPPRSFAVQDLEREIKVAMDAITLSLGTTATTRIKQSVVRRVLPNLSSEDRASIDEELEASAVEEAAERAMAAEALAPDSESGKDDPAERDDAGSEASDKSNDDEVTS